ncbi:hypothetical protein CROQUDRAFT_653143 [Cronartium quercuum f. sp. fusiforme G11]|uniref:GBD/FH3 domain-containing protein n=1 Tax=Cronartium quercuum f. sp. fusiforme G11 TaxID=708437 RepID=A0A9P6NT30_9BASI|nr:hypothetical protein CROQUDRAFT_653143 [Cronartium quercuum f. sp. fusiforme G11]
MLIQFHESSSSNGQSREVFDLMLLELIRSLRVIMNTITGSAQVLESASLIDLLARSLSASSFKSRSQAVEILAGICLLSADEGHLLVIRALSQIRHPDPTRRFQGLMESFGTHFGESSEGEQEVIDREDLSVVWEYRTGAMGLCNAIVNCVTELEERMEWREALKGDGLAEVILVSSSSPCWILDSR